jgi:hypothetical protein
MELSISSKKCCDFTIVDICKLLNGTNSQVIPTCSTNKGHIECGYLIKFIDYPDNIVSIWKLLQKKLDLECGFVKKPGQYEGCIQNWPNVFVNSNCKSRSKI